MQFYFHAFHNFFKLIMGSTFRCLEMIFQLNSSVGKRTYITCIAQLDYIYKHFHNDRQ